MPSQLIKRFLPNLRQLHIAKAAPLFPELPTPKELLRIQIFQGKEVFKS